MNLPVREDVEGWRKLALEMIAADGHSDPDRVKAIASANSMEAVMSLTKSLKRKRRRKPNPNQMGFDFGASAPEPEAIADPEVTYVATCRSDEAECDGREMVEDIVVGVLIEARMHKTAWLHSKVGLPDVGFDGGLSAARFLRQGLVNARSRSPPNACFT